MGRYFKVVNSSCRKNSGDIQLPTRSDPRSAGYDFYSPVEMVIQPGEKGFIWTDVKAFMEPDEVLKLYVRSSMGKYPVVIANGTGIIDSSYFENPKNDGNIGFNLLNLSDEPYEIKIGDRIGQGVFTKYLITDDDNATGERSGGFGSTGI
jgi:dUTP pyrophosphatase